MMREDDSISSSVTRSRILWCIISAFIGALLGVIQCELVLFALAEISLSKPISYGFGGAFILLSIVFAIRVYKSVAQIGSRVFLWILSGVALVSGVSCLAIQVDWFHYYSVWIRLLLCLSVGISASFCLAFCFLEVITMSLCAQCCSNDPNLGKNIFFSTPKQLYGLFITALVLGGIIGVIIAFLPAITEFYAQILALSAIPVGGIVGGVFGAWNQYYRSLSEYTQIEDKSSHNDL